MMENRISFPLPTPVLCNPDICFKIDEDSKNITLKKQKSNFIRIKKQIFDGETETGNGRY